MYIVQVVNKLIKCIRKTLELLFNSVTFRVDLELINENHVLTFVIIFKQRYNMLLRKQLNLEKIKCFDDKISLSNLNAYPRRLYYIFYYNRHNVKYQVTKNIIIQSSLVIFFK